MKTYTTLSSKAELKRVAQTLGVVTGANWTKEQLVNAIRSFQKSDAMWEGIAGKKV